MNKHNYLMALAMNSDVGKLQLKDTAIPVKIVEVESENNGYCGPMTTFKCLVVNDDQIARLDRLKGYINSRYGAPRHAYAAMAEAKRFEIERVIFSNPATIVFWADGTKTVVKCQEGDVYSEETGLALCFAKKALGNKGKFNDVFHEHVKNWGPESKVPAEQAVTELVEKEVLMVIPDDDMAMKPIPEAVTELVEKELEGQE